MPYGYAYMGALLKLTERFAPLRYSYTCVLQFFDLDHLKKLIVARNNIMQCSGIIAWFNELNLSLQGNDVRNLTWKLNCLCSKNVRVVSLQNLYTSNKGLSNVDIGTYNQQLQELQSDMKVQSQDLFQLEIPYWTMNPFNVVFKSGIVARESVILYAVSNWNWNSIPRINHFASEPYKRAWDGVNICIIAFFQLLLDGACV